MARQWMTPEGFVIDEDGTDEYMLPVGFVINENQEVVVAPALGGKSTLLIGLVIIV